MTSSLGWVADGIERAEAAGGLTLELRQRAGFTGRVELRPRPVGEAGGSGYPIEVDPDPGDIEDHRRPRA